MRTQEELVECNDLAAIYYTVKGISIAARLLELEEMVSQLKKLSLNDHLTGIANRRMVEELGAKIIASARRTGESIAVIMLDLNGFKPLNDTRGHAYGDEVLKTVAETLHCSIRPGDLCGRLGGDEFVIVLSKADEEVAEAIMQRFATGLQNIVGFSWGLCVGHGNLSLQEMMSKADEAMYSHKRITKGDLALVAR